ncbi:MAG: efflux RND transporter permease subunit [Acidobacteriota bacterium]
MSIPRFSVRNSVLVNMVMILVTAMGVYSLITLPRELLPQIRLNRVVIRVVYPGASPEEVEKLITKPIEDEIKSVDHIDLFLSRSIEGQCRLIVVFKSIDEDEFRRVYQDLRQEVEKVDLPEEAEKPFFLSLESSTWAPMASVIISGDLPESRMKELAEELQDEIEGMSGVDAVSLSGLRERQVWVEVDPQKLYRLNLTLEQVSRSLRRQNLSLPSGNIHIGSFEYLVRSMEEFSTLDDIRDVVIIEDRVGNHVRIRDVATVRDTYEEVRTLARFNGKPSVSLNVYKAPEGNSLELVETFRRLAEEKERALPPNVDIAVTGDNSVRITNSIQRLVNSGLLGGTLVLLLLLVFLGWRNALLVCWGIPITFLLTFAFVDAYGESLNESSLFALVLVLGMIVDDAIVVVENIARYLNRGMKPRLAAVKGTEEVMWPVFSSSLTTIAAFLPLMLLPGTIGEFMKVIPICVSFALLASLFEAQVILPSHVAELGIPDAHRHQSPINRGIRFVASHYRRLLGGILRWRWAFLPVVFVLLASSLLVIPHVGVDLYEDDEFSVVFVRVWMPEGSRIAATDAVVRQFEKAALSLPAEEVRNVVTQIGRLDTESDRIHGKNVGQVILNLVEPKDRRRSLQEIITDLKSRTAQVTGYQKVEMAEVHTGPPLGKPVEVKVKGKQLDVLREIAGKVEAHLASLPGVHSVQDDLKEGKNEIQIEVDKNRAHLVGLDTTDIVRQVKHAFDGMTATKFHDGAEEVDVVVKYQPQARQSIQDIKNLKIPSASGGLVPFDTVAHMSVRRGWAEIDRFDGDRAITVSAEVDEEITSPVAVTRALQDQFTAIGQQYPGYRLDFRGEFKEFEDAFNNVVRLFLIGIILMYLILGAQFRSYSQPILIIFAVPFAFAGSMLCLLVNNYKFSINVMFGLVALAGVSVNDSIVLIDFINRARERGASLYRAILLASKRRLRPIFLTTATTVFGLLPMAMGVGGKSVTWMPLAGTIVWGLGVATFLILMVMPPLYAALDDVRRWLTWRGRRARTVPVSAIEAEEKRIRRVG